MIYEIHASNISIISLTSHSALVLIYFNQSTSYLLKTLKKLPDTIHPFIPQCKTRKAPLNLSVTACTDVQNILFSD